MAEEKLATITRKEVDDEIRSQKFICRGANLHTMEERVAFTKRFNEAKTPQDMQKLLTDVSASVAGKRGIRPRTVKELAAAAGDDPEKVNALVFKMINGHADSVDHAMCGGNISEEIVKDGHYDGEEHEVTCPKCGMKHTYSKWANLAPEAESAKK